jgi:hypothetical protein
MVTVRRGYIRLFLDKDIYGSYGVIRGQVVLRLRKSVKASGLYVYLIGKENLFEYESTYDGDGSSGYWRLIGRKNICKTTISLGEEGEYSSGEYGFEFAVPYETRKPNSEMRGSQRVIRIWYVKAELDVPGNLHISAGKNIRFKRTRFKRMKLEKEETETPHPLVDVRDRRTQSVLGFTDKPHDEVYAEGVLFCPQCETPYHPKRGRRQCDHCGAYLP